MKKVTQSFGLAKQAALEKMGKAETQVDTEEAIKAKNDLSTMRNNYGDMASALKKYSHEGGPLMYSQGGVLSEMLMVFGVNQDGTLLGAVLQEIARAQRGTNDEQITLINLVKEKWTSPALALLDTDIKRAKELKDKQESARMRLDVANTEFKNQQKKGGPKAVQAEAEYNATKEKYDYCTKELTQFMEGLVEKIHKELTAQLRLYAEAQFEYFTKGVGIWKTTLDSLKEAEARATSPSSD